MKNIVIVTSDISAKLTEKGIPFTMSAHHFIPFATSFRFPWREHGDFVVAPYSELHYCDDADFICAESYGFPWDCDDISVYNVEADEEVLRLVSQIDELYNTKTCGKEV